LNYPWNNQFPKLFLNQIIACFFILDWAIFNYWVCQLSVSQFAGQSVEPSWVDVKSKKKTDFYDFYFEEKNSDLQILKKPKKEWQLSNILMLIFDTSVMVRWSFKQVFIPFWHNSNETFAHRFFSNLSRKPENLKKIVKSMISRKILKIRIDFF